MGYLPCRHGPAGHTSRGASPHASHRPHHPDPGPRGHHRRRPGAAGLGRTGHAVGDDLELTLLATTDLHGRVQDWDYFKDAPYTERSGDATGLARVSSVVDAVRAEQGEESVFVVDNGDFLQGTPLTYFYAKQEPVTETGVEHPMAAAYDAIGYDAQVVGNHEYNYGLDLLEAYTEDVDHPVLGANVVDATTGEPYHQPYTLQRMKVPGHKPVTVGIIGLTTPGSAIWDKGNVEGRVEFLDMVADRAALGAARWTRRPTSSSSCPTPASAARRPTGPACRWRTRPTSSPAPCPASTSWSSATPTATGPPRS